MATGSRNFASVVIILTACGMVGLVLTVFLGFEEPNDTLLVASAILILSGPVAILTHLWCTHSLTPDDKRIWIRAFLSARAPQVLAAYLESPDLKATTTALRDTKGTSDHR